MGLITFGVPKNVVIELARHNQSRVFVETGTYQGNTSRWAAQHFPQVHTIERSSIVYNQFGPSLNELPQVRRYFGDSRTVLPGILRELGTSSGVFWLDGHWSGGDTAGATDECPLLDELAHLSSRNDDLILIDDARLFLCAPPVPHDPAQWPGIDKIVAALPNYGKDRIIQVIDDVIFIVPDKPALRDTLIEHARQCTAAETRSRAQISIPKKLRAMLLFATSTATKAPHSRIA